MKCPACDAPVIEHPTTIDGQVFECREHGCFGVSGTVLAMDFDGMDAWTKRNAFDHAKTYMRLCDSFPVITSYHL